ncbi:Gfo/Idh/MocA family protein [Microlunatus sp. Gsoil 973]|uniref:Gfo/Idh/MocA family protein n=1 Tax=Microlunatus sp. Gsoil 973 TaxID=2672569 RepID=UPI0012B4FE31|nr:Gfo/Idh/MocA family oxidoreductase [Microlunatus sp. Gsoil 973]QGN34417.1 gfo/Idh/MocA family oxidoreductase [Microlunatus sp. Gsoil 973]
MTPEPNFADLRPDTDASMHAYERDTERDDPPRRPPERPRARGQSSVADLAFEPHPEVRIGLIGAGGRQGGLVSSLAPVAGARVVAVADRLAEPATAVSDLLVRQGKPEPQTYDGDDAVDRLLARADIDLVLIATPWPSHAPLAIQAMRAGRHVGLEVPAALTIEECWALVDTSEQTRRHCVMLENCCYGRTELLALQLVRAGALGELLHAECSYNHDLRGMLVNDQPWRRQMHIEHDRNLYPTHGLGPVASYFGINRGDRFTRLVSMGSPSVGLQKWRDANVPEGDPRRDEAYRCADINTSLLQTAAGRSIVLQHQVIGPRPYDRRNQVVGTNGIFTDYPPRIFLEDDPVLGGIQGGQGASDSEEEEYRDIDAYLPAFEHPLWRQEGDKAMASGGHGGMDYLVLLRLVQAMRAGAVPDMDVYDAAAWSAPGPLSEESVANGNAPVEFPDFTRGDWKRNRPGIP